MSSIYVWGEPLVPAPQSADGDCRRATVWIFNRPTQQDWAQAMLAYDGQQVRIQQCDWPLPGPWLGDEDRSGAEAGHYCAARALDEQLLNDYLDLIGVDALSSSLTLLMELIPNYLSELALHYVAGDASAFGRSAHTLKGACASLGLKRLQQLAEKMQHARSPLAEQAPVLTELLAVVGRDLRQLRSRLDAEIPARH